MKRTFCFVPDAKKKPNCHKVPQKASSKGDNLTKHYVEKYHTIRFTFQISAYYAHGDYQKWVNDFLAHQELCWLLEEWKKIIVLLTKTNTGLTNPRTVQKLSDNNHSKPVNKLAGGRK